MTNLDELEALARAATEQEITPGWYDADFDHICRVDRPYIAAANPATVLSLIAEVRRMMEALEQIAVKANNGKCHGLLADGHCEDIEEIALAALGRKP